MLFKESLFALRIIWNPKIKNATLLIVNADGTYSYHSALNG
jgi:hypothetical protein